MADKLWLSAHELRKVQDVIKNKTLLIEQYDAKIEKATRLRERAQATLPSYQKQLTSGMTKLRADYTKHEASLIREVKIADNPEKRERATRHLNNIRQLLDLPDDPKIET